METNQTEEQLKLIHKQHKKTEHVFPRIMYGYDMTNKGSSKPSIYTQIKHTVSFSALIHKHIIKSVSIQPRTTKNTHVPPSKSKINSPAEPLITYMQIYCSPIPVQPKLARKEQNIEPI